MITGQFVMNATVSLVDRSDDGWSVFVFGDHAAIFQTPSIGREKKCE